MVPPREIWTFTDWLGAGGWGMYAIEAGAAVALPLNVLNAFTPGRRVRRAAIVATTAVVALGLAFWWWSLHRLEAVILSLPEDSRSELRSDAQLEVRGVVETVTVVVIFFALALLVSLVSMRVLHRDERQFQPRRMPWPPLGFVLYALAGIFLLPQGAFRLAYAWGMSSEQRPVLLLGGLVALFLGTVIVLFGSLLRWVRVPTAPVG